MTPTSPALDIQAIMETLPHRYPFLLVDRVLEVVPGERLLAQKNVSINEPFFVGHFPNYSVMPGVLVIEALAQAAGILSFKTIQSQAQEGQIYFFAGIDNCRFKRPVVPGDVLMLEVRIERHARGIWKYKTRAMVEGQLAAEADLMCALREVPKSA